MSAEAPATSPGGKIVIYEGEGGEVHVEVRFDRETVWPTQRQMADLFETSTDNVSLHLNNMFSTQELEREATTEDSSVVRTEGSRQVRRTMSHYNLDAIISVGPRTDSRRVVRPLHRPDDPNDRPGRVSGGSLRGHAMSNETAAPAPGSQIVGLRDRWRRSAGRRPTGARNGLAVPAGHGGGLCHHP